jgi:hypothetical protein
MSMSYQFVGYAGGLPGTNQTASTSPPGVRPGFIADAVDPNYGCGQFMWVAGASASTAASGDAVMLMNGGQNAMQLVSGNTGSKGPVGIACGNISATNVSGWVQIQGFCDIAKLHTAGTASAPGVVLQVATTAGRLQTTASAAGFVIAGMVIGSGLTATSAQSDACSIYMNYPFYNGSAY